MAKKKAEAPKPDPVGVEPAADTVETQEFPDPVVDPDPEPELVAAAKELVETIGEESAYAQANLTAAENNVAPYNGIDDWRQRTGGLKGEK